MSHCRRCEGSCLFTIKTRLKQRAVRIVAALRPENVIRPCDLTHLPTPQALDYLTNLKKAGVNLVGESRLHDMQS